MLFFLSVNYPAAALNQQKAKDLLLAPARSLLLFVFAFIYGSTLFYVNIRGRKIARPGTLQTQRNLCRAAEAAVVHGPCCTWIEPRS
jgi:hypothetical protein